MTTFRLRTDLRRVWLGDFALPLGIEPVDQQPPTEGYTVIYNSGEEDEPDTYAFHIVVSHDRLRPLIERVFELLPEQVSPIIEIDSYDAYRTVDVHIGREDEPITRDEFLDLWQEFEPVFLEDGAIGAGANSDEPFIEVFIDQWKGVSIHIPLEMRDRVDGMLGDLGLSEVADTWPSGNGREHSYDATIRPVLETSSSEWGTLDDLLYELRRQWHLELNIDPEVNLDEAGRELGMTLWNASLVVAGAGGMESDQPTALLSVWLSARSWAELELLVSGVLEEYPEWEFDDWYAVTRVAFDDRPGELDHLAPRRLHPEVHLVDLHHDRAAEQAEDHDGTAD